MSYLGSKGQAGVFQTIIGNMPPHSIYVEPFLGSGKIFLTKLPAPVLNIGIDVDPATIAAFRIPASFPARLANIVNSDSLRELATMKLTLRDEVLIYCDPPYLRSTRTSRHGYRHEFDTVDQHAALLTLLHSMTCMVMISGYPSKLYSDMLTDWRCVSYRTRTRGRTVTECLWCNFPEPTELHDWRFAGRNFRERLTYKRRVSRLTAKLDALSPRCRGFVLNAIRQRYNQRGVPADSVTIDAAGSNAGNDDRIRRA